MSFGKTIYEYLTTLEDQGVKYKIVYNSKRYEVLQYNVTHVVLKVSDKSVIIVNLKTLVDLIIVEEK